MHIYITYTDKLFLYTFGGHIQMFNNPLLMKLYVQKSAHAK